jgi:hypothetical protein
MSQNVQFTLFPEYIQTPPELLTPSGLPKIAFFLCNGIIKDIGKGSFGVMYSGGDLFINRKAITESRETRYMFITNCTEDEAKRICDIMNGEYAPPHPDGFYSWCKMDRANYLMGGHKDESGNVREDAWS